MEVIFITYCLTSYGNFRSVAVIQLPSGREIGQTFIEDNVTHRWCCGQFGTSGE
jgi:hypothetical protein